MSVVVMDKRPFYRKLLTSYINEFNDVKCVMEAETSGCLHNLMSSFKFDVAFCNLEQLNSSRKWLRKLRNDNEETHFIIIPESYDELTINNYRRNKINGILSSESSPDKIKYAIKSIQNGYTYIDDLVIQKMAPEQTPIHFSNRELEIFKLIIQEMTNKEIAEFLCLSKRTVDNYKSRLIKKVEVKGSLGLVRYAIENKLF